MAGWAGAGLALVVILLTRLTVRVRRRFAPGWIGSLATCAVFLAAFELLRLPVTLAAWSLWPDGAGLGAHGLAAMRNLFLDVLLGAPALAVVLAVLQAAPRWGWAALSLAAAVLIFVAVLVPPVTLVPSARGDVSAAASPAAASLQAFARRGGLGADRVYSFESADPLAVDAEGLGPVRHLAASRAALAAPRPETYAALGHLLGHYRHKDLWSMALLWSGFAALAFYAASRFDGAKGADHLPRLGLIAWTVALIATPAFNLFDQAINDRADAYALGLTHDPDALCRWLIATEAADKARPSPLEAVLFYDHPPLYARLLAAERWKAAHGGL